MADENTLTEIVGNEVLTADLSEAQVLVLRGLAGKAPRVNATNNHWEVYNNDTQAWVDTGAAATGAAGADGEDGHSPYINSTGYWVFWNDSTGAWVTTNYKASGQNGADGHSPYIGQNSHWFAWSENLAMFDDTGVLAHGQDAYSPYIGNDGCWYAWDDRTQEWMNTNVEAQGPQGDDYVLTNQDKQDIAAMALPTVTAADNGKVLGVVNGAWAAKADESYVTPQHFGAKGDGVTDDTAAINACFSSGASNIYFPSGTYLVDAHHAGFGHETEGGLKPQSNSVITLDADAVIKCTTSPTDFYNILHFVGVSNVIIQGGKIVGDKATHVQISQPTYEFGHGVGIQNSTNIVVRDMEISDCIGDGVIFNYSGNTDITLDNLTIHDCRRQGVSLVSGDGIVISNCKIYDISGTNPQSGIDIEPDGDKSVTNVVIDSCNIRDTVGASVIVTNVSNVIDQIHITGCLLDHALFLGGTNVTMDGSKASRVSVKSEKAPIVSACSIEEIAISGGNSAFVGCNFISSGKENFITVTSDVVSGNPAESIVFSECYFDVGCTHFIFMPANAIGRIKLLKFDNCRAKITHALTSTYASSGFSNFMPTRTVISGSRFEFTAKIYQLFTAKPSSTVALEIIDSEIVNSNEYKTNYLISGNAAYDVWIDNSAFTKYGNMLYGGESASGEIVLFNNSFFNFTHPTGKVQADNVTITNITTDNIEKIGNIPTKTSDLVNDSGYLTSVTVDDALSTTSENPVQNKVVKAALDEKGTYSKPSGGIPKSDLAEAVQTSLGKADTALQQHQSLSGYATQSWVKGKGYLTLSDLPIYNGGVT